MTGKLLETTTALHSFVRALETSQFQSYVDYLARPWYRLWSNFIFGIVYGLGFAIGASVLLGFAVWVMTKVLTQLPFIGDFFETLQEFFTKDNIQTLQSGNMMDTLGRMFEAFKANVLENYQQNP